MDLKVSDIPAYYISLRSDGAKRKRVQQVLADAGFADSTWLEGVKAKSKKLGCALAHRNALEYVLHKNVFPCLVVEDDVLLHETYESFTVPDDADAVYVGLSIYGLHGGRGVPNYAADPVSKDVYRLWNMLAAHAIVYTNPEYVEYLLKVNKLFVDMGTNQDKGRAETMKYWNVYGLAKPIFYQDGKYQAYTKFEMPSSERRSLDFFYL